MQVVMNKFFLLNPEKNGANPCCGFREKRKNHRLTPTNFNFEKKGRHVP